VREAHIRFEYLTAFRKLTHAFNKTLPRAEALDYFKTYQRLGAINELASQFLKDDRLSMKGVPKKLRGITDEFLTSQGIEQKVAPISVLDPDFQKQAAQRNRAKTKAAEVVRNHHVFVLMSQVGGGTARSGGDSVAILQRIRK
jgi:type I restriction enzyme, R subunit